VLACVCVCVCVIQHIDVQSSTTIKKLQHSETEPVRKVTGCRLSTNCLRHIHTNGDIHMPNLTLSACLPSSHYYASITKRLSTRYLCVRKRSRIFIGNVLVTINFTR
jgi:hypothetical protein